jgi:hypothetical protein
MRPSRGTESEGMGESKMSRRSIRNAGVLLLLAIGLMTGCSSHTPRDIEGPETANLLFGSDRSTTLATGIGRSQWPATYGAVESVQDTIFIEYYRDQQGHAFLERNNPRRVFRSYRVGSQHR